MSYDLDLVRHHKQEAIKLLSDADEVATEDPLTYALLAIAHILVAIREELDVLAENATC